ncbi:MAG TPA: hypothetical protein VED63_03015, partial [Acidimicrobiales bacterium]|nr:hypothetical protein [Acidimicrobiales bacterium]
WASLLLLGQDGQAGHESLAQSLARGRMCELLAAQGPTVPPELAFTAGLLSSFDLLLGVELERALSDLPIETSLREAVLQGRGALGELVADVKDYQLGRPERAVRSGIGESGLSSAAVESLIWAVEVSNTFSEPWEKAG